MVDILIFYLLKIKSCFVFSYYYPDRTTLNNHLIAVHPEDFDEFEDDVIEEMEEVSVFCVE